MPQTYGALCALAEQHGVKMTEEVRALLRAVEAADGERFPAAPADARSEELRKGLFEARDAMRVMSNWVKQSDPAGHSWAVHMVDRANDVLSGGSAPTSLKVAVGEEWYARLPHAIALIHCRVLDVTSETVLLLQGYGCNGVRYLRSDVTFIERVAATANNPL
ncbi:hypothetical protein LMG6871_02846 [Ralstonia edaphis]|uniref:hypothetical protein n=1 Tax=Ralstonia edaphi TaxID=3058599 RepID=UPI0028F6BE67|nr:hypothetical protein [Ralstonia sp. LMG 6871]CAJ0719412.1 hypothetical protein LMG6871_02846 [Ralstonia sp. LMG 6871]